MRLTIKSNIRIERSTTKNILIDSYSGEFYECNETALFLIQKMLTGKTQKELVQSLLEEYDLTLKEAHVQVDCCIEILSSMGMLNEKL